MLKIKKVYPRSLAQSGVSISQDVQPCGHDPFYMLDYNVIINKKTADINGMEKSSGLAIDVSAST